MFPDCLRGGGSGNLLSDLMYQQRHFAEVYMVSHAINFFPLIAQFCLDFSQGSTYSVLCYLSYL